MNQKYVEVLNIEKQNTSVTVTAIMYIRTANYKALRVIHKAVMRVIKRHMLKYIWCDIIPDTYNRILINNVANVSQNLHTPKCHCLYIAYLAHFGTCNQPTCRVWYLWILWYWMNIEFTHGAMLFSYVNQIIRKLEYISSIYVVFKCANEALNVDLNWDHVISHKRLITEARPPTS